LSGNNQPPGVAYLSGGNQLIAYKNNRRIGIGKFRYLILLKTMKPTTRLEIHHNF
jgi:hypothetical protein